MRSLRPASDPLIEVSLRLIQHEDIAENLKKPHQQTDKQFLPTLFEASTDPDIVLIMLCIPSPD